MSFSVLTLLTSHDIVKELKRCPAKIKPCKRAVLSNLFLSSSTDSITWPPSYSVLNRVPQEVAKLLLTTLNPALTEDVLKLMKKNDKHIIHKLMYKGLCADANWTIGPSNKQAWAAFWIYRAMCCGNPLGDLVWSSDFEVDWKRPGNGYYTLEKDPASSPFYTHIVARGKHRVLIPKRFNVDDAWVIDNNWSAPGAVLVQPAEGRFSSTVRLDRRF